MSKQPNQNPFQIFSKLISLFLQGVISVFGRSAKPTESDNLQDSIQNRKVRSVKFRSKKLLNEIQKNRLAQKQRQKEKTKRFKRFALTAFTIFVLTIQLSGLTLSVVQPAYAAVTLAIEPITWDFVGLDSNKPATEGPNTYVTGARVCNLSTTEDAVNVKVRFNKDGVDNGYTFIRLQGADTYTFPLIPKNDGTTGTTSNTGFGTYVFDTPLNGSSYKTKYRIAYTPKNCQDFYYNFETTRSTAAWQTYQRYYIEAWADNVAGFVQTPRPRQIYIEQLISQSRNSVNSFSCTTAANGTASGAVTVVVGEAFTCTASASTATAYPALSFTADIPNVVFQILDVNTTYSSGGVNSTVYGDGCGWVQDPTDPRYHKSPSQCNGESNYTDQYPYPSTNGGVGLNVTTKYKIKVISFPSAAAGNPIKVSNVILDNSGGSYHYNADYGSGINVMNITVANPVPADLQIVKSHTGNFIYGDNIYTLAVTNNTLVGHGVAKGAIVVNDTLPQGYTYVSTDTGTSAGWTCSANGQNVVCTNPNDLAMGATSTIKLKVNVSASALSNSVNRATVSSSTIDDVPANNSTQDPTFVIIAANLKLTKSDGSATQINNLPSVVVGNSLTYNFTVQNLSSSVAATQPIIITDTLPTGLIYSSASGTDWSCSAQGQNVTCTYNQNLAGGATAPTLSMVVSTSSNGIPSGTSAVINNTATVSSQTTESDSNDNSSSDNFTLTKPVSDLTPTKTDNGIDFITGFDGLYVITVENKGVVTTTGNIEIREPLPTGFKYSSVSGVGPTGAAITWACTTGINPTTATACVSGTTTGNITFTYTGALAPGQKAYLYLTVVAPATVPTPNPVTNNITVFNANDGTVQTKTASDTTTIVANAGNPNTSDISVNKTLTKIGIATPSPACTLTAGGQVESCTAGVNPSQAIEYTIIINNPTNAGPAGVTFSLTDVVPSEINVTSWSCAANAKAVCNVPTSGTTNTVNPNVTLSKNGGIATITVVGNLKSASNLGSLTSITNTAIIPTTFGTTEVEANTSNNSSSTTFPINRTDLSVKKTDGDASFAIGIDGTYTLTVANTNAAGSGLDTVGKITVLEDLPNTFTFKYGTSAPGSSGWSCILTDATNNIVTCSNDGPILAGGQSQINLVVAPTTATGSPFTNLAQVITPGDNNSANNGNPPGTATPGTTFGYDTTPVIAPDVDLQITKSLIGGGNLSVGQPASYQISLVNRGPTVATASVGTPIVVTDTLPVGLTYVSANGAGWACSASGQIVTCNLTSNLGINQASTINLNVVVSGTAPASVDNIAKVAKHTDELQVNNVSGNNLSLSRNDFTLTSTVNQASDLGIVKTASGSFLQGQDATFLIQVTNNGFSAYTGSVVVTDILDSNFTFKSTGSGGNGFSCIASGQTVTCTKSGGLTVGQTVTFPVVVTVSASAPTGNLSNTAQFDSATLTSAKDPTGDTNDTSTVTVNIQSNTSTLTLSKDDGDGETPDEPTTASAQTKFAVGGIGKYTFIVNNAGPASATKPVTITENTTLPTGLTYAGYSLTANWKCTGTLGANNFSCVYGQWFDTNNNGDRFEGATATGGEDCGGISPTYTSTSGGCFVEQDLPSGSLSGVEIKVNVAEVTGPSNISTISGGAYTNLTLNTGKVTSGNNTGVTATESTAIIKPADLQVTKTGVDTLTISPAGTGTYTVRITNLGPGVSQPDIYLEDYLPTGLIYDSSASVTIPSGWSLLSYNSGSNQLTYKGTTALAVGAFVDIPVPVKVVSSVPASVINLVRVQGFTPEPIDPSGIPCDVSFTTQPTNNCATKVTSITNGTPSLNLVKRITEINGIRIDTFSAGTASAGSDANDSKWPASLPYLAGGIDCTTSGTTCKGIKGGKPGDIVEYTIYFLANGTDALKNVKICDHIPANTTFRPDTYAVGKGILLGWDSTALPNPSTLTGTVQLTNIIDVPTADKGKFVAASTALDNPPCGPAPNTDGGVVVDVVSGATVIPIATGAGAPVNSYGFVRFKVTVN